MATVNTNDLRIKNSRNFIGSLNDENTAKSYVFVGRVQPWLDENVPPPPENNNNEFYSTWDNIFTMKRINNTDAYHMIPRVTWTSGEVYDRYQNNYSLANLSFTGASNIYDARFVVINRLKYVYVCLDNNNNAASTAEPLDAGDGPFFTADGYQWLRVYNVLGAQIDNNSTNNFIPIAELTANFVNKRTEGEVYTVLIDSPGSGYTINPSGASNQINEYYAHIDGDGAGAVAKVTITNTAISKVEVVRYGSDYTFATLDFTANNVYSTLGDLDLAVNGLNPEGDGGFRSTVIISPPGGWGSDLSRQLGGTRVGVFSTLGYSEFDYFPASFRQVGIMQDFTYEGSNTDPIQACYSLKTSAIPVGESFKVGQEITQVVAVPVNTSGEERFVNRNAKGFVIGWDSTNNVIRYTQSSANVDVDGELYRFGGTNNITQGDLSVTIDSTYNDTVTKITFVNGVGRVPVLKYTGLMTYLANVSPVVRNPDQSERINLIISF